MSVRIPTFSLRHNDAIGEAIGLGLWKGGQTEKEKLLNFIDSVLSYVILSHKKISENLRNLAIDMALCTNNYYALTKITSQKTRPSDYLYCAYGHLQLKNNAAIMQLMQDFRKNYLSKSRDAEKLFIYATIESFYYLAINDYTSLKDRLSVQEYIMRNNPALSKNFFNFIVNLVSGKAYLTLGLIKRAEEKAFWIFQKASSLEDPFFKLKGLLLLAEIEIAKANWTKVQRLLAQSISLAQEIGREKEVLEVSYKLELAMGNYERALNILLKLYDETKGDLKEKIELTLRIVEVAMLINRIDIAERHLKATIELDQKNQFGLLDPYLYSAWLSLEKGDTEEAFVLLEYCKNKIDNSKDLKKLLLYKYLLGVYEHKSKLYDVATDYLHEANKLALKLRNYEYLIKTQAELTQIALEKFEQSRELSDYTHALQSIEDLQYLADQQGLPKLKCDVLLAKGILYFLAKNLDRAEQTLKKVVELAKESKFSIELQKAREVLNIIEEIREGKAIEETIVTRFSVLTSEPIEMPQTTTATSTLFGIAIVEIGTGIMRYRYRTPYDKKDITSLIPTTVAAVNIYAENVLKEEFSFTEIQEEGYTLLIEPLKNEFMVVVIIDRPSYEMKKAFDLYIEKLKEKSHLLEFHQDDALVAELNKITEEVFKEYIDKSTEQEFEIKKFMDKESL